MSGPSAGVTLLELLVVLVILGVLAAVAGVAPRTPSAPREPPGGPRGLMIQIQREALRERRPVTVTFIDTTGTAHSATAFPDGQLIGGQGYEARTGRRIDP